MNCGRERGRPVSGATRPRSRRAVLRLFTALVVALAVAVPAVAQESRPALDLNRATREEIRQLPIPETVAEAIYRYRTYTSYFESVYDLMRVEGMTPELLETLKPLVATIPPEVRDADMIERYEEAFFQVQQYLGQEGAREEVADEYLDMIRDPINVNRLRTVELQSFLNVSPVDAVAIARARERVGTIENERQLRSSDGLSYWGYRNLREYVVYEDPLEKGEVRGHLQVMTLNKPYRLDERALLIEPLPGTPVGNFSEGTGWGVRGLDNARPAVATKLRLRLGSAWRGGMLVFRDVGEQQLDETVKGFLSWRNLKSRKYDVDRVVAGTYRLGFGQGLVMDNSDYFVARKTGYGYNVRPRFVIGDLARSQEYNLRGLALEAHAGPLRGIGFFSHDKKDGLLNPDGTLNRYVTMKPRFENYELEDMVTETGTQFGLRRDAFRETIYGGNLTAEIVAGTMLGISGWEARYDRAWDPDVNTVIPASNQGLLEPRDREILASYDSRQLGDFRRVIGAEFQTVYQNVALQGEYAKLDANPANGLDGLLGAAPEAYTLSAYVQYEDLNALVLWRDYDVGFDNPYARGFSEDPRYEQTLLEDPFRLQNPLLSYLAENTPQMKAERGLYFNVRYRISRKFTLDALEFDDWTRVADGQELRRYVVRATYNPIFPLQFRIRQRVSSRGEEIQGDFRRFRGWETRFETIVRLPGGLDRVGLLLVGGETEFTPRPRLSGAVETGADNPIGLAGAPGKMLGGFYSHFFNPRLGIILASSIYDGFFYNYEDNEFVVIDDVGFRNFAVLASQLSDTVRFRFKVTHDRTLSRNNLDIRQFNDEFSAPYEGGEVRRKYTSFRLQLDYEF